MGAWAWTAVIAIGWPLASLAVGIVLGKRIHRADVREARQRAREYRRAIERQRGAR